MNVEVPIIDDLVPIRDISRMTGVNTVTLRAWERRYGLLKPQRTAKGHRLYSRRDIDTVKEVQLWLGRGLAISKVNAILANKGKVTTEQSIDSVWTEVAQKIRQALVDLERRPLERLMDELLALYPAEMIADALMAPFLNELKCGEYSSPSRLAFFNSVVIEQLYRVQNRQRQVVAQQQRVLVLASHASDSQLLPLLLNYSLLVNDFQAEFMGYLSPQEAIFCAQKLDVSAVILTGYEVLDASELQLQLKSWCEKKSLPILLVGRVAELYQAASLGANNIYACTTQQQALMQINTLFKM